MNDILTMISTVGFPTVACIGIAWFCKYTNDNYREDLKEANAEHKAEMDKIAEALNNNTIALTKLCERLEREEKDNA